MKYLVVATFAISLLYGGFASTPTQANYRLDANEENCAYWNKVKKRECEEARDRRTSDRGEVTDIEPLTETAFDEHQGGDRGGDFGGDAGGDFGDGDRAAASTAAE